MNLNYKKFYKNLWKKNNKKWKLKQVKYNTILSKKKMNIKKKRTYK